MKEDLLDILQCPVCGGRDFLVTDRVSDGNEIRAAVVTCSCGAVFPVEKGVITLMPDPREAVVSEIEGWSHRVDADALDEAGRELQRRTILALPRLDSDLEADEEGRKLWEASGDNFSRFALDGELEGKMVLDVGAGRCWTSAAMAGRGSRVVALDILTRMYIGLETADIFLEERDVFFERVRADMHHLPFRDGSFDLVVESASAHHADEPELFFREASRVLAPGGRLAILSEPIAWRGDEPPPEVADGITEKMIGVNEWFRLFREGGFVPRRCEATSGRILCCLMGKSGCRSAAVERAVAWRHRASALGNFLFWRAASGAKSAHSRLRGPAGVFKEFLRRLVIAVSLPTSTAVLRPGRDYVRALLSIGAAPPAGVGPGTGEDSRWLGTGWYPIDPRAPVPARRAHKKANLVLSVPPGRLYLLVKLGVTDDYPLERPVAVDVLLGGEQAATIDLEKAEMVSRRVVIPPEVRDGRALRVSLRVRRVASRPFLSRMADRRALGVMVERISAGG